MYLRKIELMYHLFGKSENHRCGECSNLCEYRYEKAYRKCKIYGCTSSQSSDWAKKYTACGMFNKEWAGRPVIEIKIKDSENQDIPLKGQISLFL